MENVGLSKANQAYISNQTQNNNISKTTTSQPTRINDGESKMKKALVALGVLGSTVAIGIGIYRGKISSKKTTEVVTDISKDGIGKLLKENDKLTGKFSKTMEDGSKVVLEYTEGVLQKSTKTASDGTQLFEKIYKKADNGDLLVNNKNITELSNQIKKHQKDYNDLIVKQDFNLDELQKFDRKNLSQTQIDELDEKITELSNQIKKHQEDYSNLMAKEDASLDELQKFDRKNLSQTQIDELDGKIKTKENEIKAEAERLAKEEAEKKEALRIANAEIEREKFKKSLEELSDDEFEKIQNQIQEEYNVALEKAKTIATQRGMSGEISSFKLVLNEKELEEFISAYNKNVCVDTVKLKRRWNSRCSFLNKLLQRDGDKPLKTQHSFEFLSTEEMEEFEKYYDDAAGNIAMRTGKGYINFDPEVMLEGFKKAPALKEEAVVYRGIGPSLQEGSKEFLKDFKEGYVFTDKGFISTSASIESRQLSQFISNDGIAMRIHLPKGTKGIYGGYDEFLLPCDSKIKVNKMEIIDGVKVADCEYIL